MPVKSIQVRGDYRKLPYIVLFTRTVSPEKGWLADVQLHGHKEQTITLPPSDRPGQTIAERLVRQLAAGRLVKSTPVVRQEARQQYEARQQGRLKLYPRDES
jgi:hypothetical protein